MGEVIRLIGKSELERARLIREARAIYDSIFPQAGPVDKIADGGLSENAQADGEPETTSE
jgi:hypothetical protein